MRLDIALLDELIRQTREDKHSIYFLEGVVAHDTKGADSLEEALQSATFYGDSKKLATLVQLVFLRTLLMRPVDGEMWAAEALKHMDQLREMFARNALSLVDSSRSSAVADEMLRDVEEASRDVGA